MRNIQLTTKQERQQQLLAAVFRKHLERRGEWDAFYYVDLCAEASRGKDNEVKRLLMEIQEIWRFRRWGGSCCLSTLIEQRRKE